MTGPDADICEAWLNETWNEIDISAALEMEQKPLMRCAECHGKVSAFKEYSDGARPHFEHKQAHKGCSTKATFDGVRRRHPSAID